MDNPQALPLQILTDSEYEDELDPPRDSERELISAEASVIINQELPLYNFSGPNGNLPPYYLYPP